MIFNPNSRELCEYYGVNYDTKDKFVGQDHEEWYARNFGKSDKPEVKSLMPSRKPYSTGSEDYFPQQSRDYALSNTIECECTLCPANKNGYCSVPALIKITAGGVCRTGIAFVEQALGKTKGTRLEGTEPLKKDNFTPFWFWNKYEENCPELSHKEIKEYEEVKTFGSERAENWHSDVLDVNKKRR